MKTTMTKKQFAKKYKAAQIKTMIRELAGKAGQTLDVLPTKKSELVDVYYDLLEASAASETRKAIQSKPPKAKDGKSTLSEDDIILKKPLEVVFKEGILFRIDGHCWWGKSSKVNEDEINAPRDILTGVKTLIDAKKLAALGSLRAYGERVVKSRGYSFLGLRGVYYVPKAFIMEVEKELTNVQTKFYELRDKFIKSYPRLKKEWKIKAGKYYDESLYPSEAALKNKFRFSWTKFVVTLPDSNMGILSDEELKKEAEKQKQNMIEFINSSLVMLAGKFVKMLKNVKERTEGDDVLRPKSVSSMKNFINTFDAWNFTNNQNLSTMVSEARKALGELSAKEINNDDKVRSVVNKQISTIVKEFESAAQFDDRFARALDF